MTEVLVNLNQPDHVSSKRISDAPSFTKLLLFFKFCQHSLLHICFFCNRCTQSPIPLKPTRRKRVKLLCKATNFSVYSKISALSRAMPCTSLGMERSGSLQTFLETCTQINASNSYVFSQNIYVFNRVLCDLDFDLCHHKKRCSNCLIVSPESKV